MIRIENELASEARNTSNEEKGDEIDIEQIADRDIIKEDDRGTDMNDFEKYLIATFGEKTKDDETQTDKVFKKHRKIGVKPQKLGLMKDKETFTDQRMF